jgi:N-acetylmuramoyl-L-alanine amidase
MHAKPYSELTDQELLALVMWREARGESFEGRRAVGWTVKNRVAKPSWWGHDYHSVILKAWQFSSFNTNDPNETKWPAEDDQIFEACYDEAGCLLDGADYQDLSDGATHYYDRSIGFPKAWGPEAEWENTLSLGRLRFWKMNPVSNNAESVQAAVNGDN